MNQTDQNFLSFYSGLPESSASERWIKKYLEDSAFEWIRMKEDGEWFYKSKPHFTFEEMYEKYNGVSYEKRIKEAQVKVLRSYLDVSYNNGLQTFVQNVCKTNDAKLLMEETERYSDMLSNLMKDKGKNYDFVTEVKRLIFWKLIKELSPNDLDLYLQSSLVFTTRDYIPHHPPKNRK